MEEDFDSDETYAFDPTGRERFAPKMKAVGYVELPQFEGKESDIGYWCESCSWYQHREESPTGAWCLKWGFSDRGWGCCGSWATVAQNGSAQS